MAACNLASLNAGATLEIHKTSKEKENLMVIDYLNNYLNIFSCMYVTTAPAWDFTLFFAPYSFKRPKYICGADNYFIKAT